MNEQPAAKKCTKCGVEKGLPEFGRNSASPDGLQYKCKECCNQYRRQYYDKNSVEIIRRKLNYNKPPHIKAAQATRAKAHRKASPQKYKARNVVNHSVRDGNLVRPPACSKCHDKGKVEAHHYDYYKPLDIVWLCKRCHTQLHFNQGREAKNAAVDINDSSAERKRISH